MGRAPSIASDLCSQMYKILSFKNEGRSILMVRVEAILISIFFFDAEPGGRHRARHSSLG